MSALFPGNTAERAIQRRMIREIDNHFVEAVEHLVLPLMKPDLPDAAERSAQGIAALPTEYAHWETALTGDWVGGTAPSAVDLTPYPSAAMIRRLESPQPARYDKRRV